MPIYVIADGSTPLTLFSAPSNNFVFMPQVASPPNAPSYFPAPSAPAVFPTMINPPTRQTGDTNLDRTTPCRHFAEGKCNRRKCRFSHELKSIVKHCG